MICHTIDILWFSILDLESPNALTSQRLNAKTLYRPYIYKYFESNATTRSFVLRPTIRHFGLMQQRHKIFDAHFHIGAYGTQEFAGHRIEPIDAGLDHADGAACEAYLEKHGIRAGVIVPTYLERQETAFEYNNLVLEAVNRYEALLGGLWVSPLESLEELLSATLKRLPHPKIKALKIASNTWAPYSLNPGTWSKAVRRNIEEILELAGAHQMIIHFHTGYLPGADPLDVEAFMSEYGTRGRYQWVHMGEAIAPAFKFAPRFVEWVEAGYDVYTDSSIVPGFAPHWLLNLLDRKNLGFDRVFFATDSPWGRFPTEYWKIEGLDIDESIKKQVFWANAARAYGVL